MLEDFIDELLYFIEENKKKVLLSFLLLLILSPWFFYIYANYNTKNPVQKKQTVETNTKKIERLTRNNNSIRTNRVITPDTKNNLVWLTWSINLTSTWLTDLSLTWTTNLTFSWLIGLTSTWLTDWKILDKNWFTQEDFELIQKYNLMKKIDNYNTIQKINRIKDSLLKSAYSNIMNKKTLNTNISHSWTLPNPEIWNSINIDKELLTNPGSGTLNIDTWTSQNLDSWALNHTNTWILGIVNSSITPYDIEKYFENEAYYNVWNWVFKKIITLISTTDNTIKPEPKICDNWYFELWKYSNIPDLTTIVMPYSNSLNNLEITDENTPLFQWTGYNYKVLNINWIKSWAITFETYNPNKTYNWVFTLCVQN